MFLSALHPRAIEACVKCILSEGLTGSVDPVSVDVHSGREICHAVALSYISFSIFFESSGCVSNLDGHSRRLRTVDGSCVALAADLAFQRTMANFLLKLNGDRLLMVAEEATEHSW